jgi:feruloyl esterase
MRMLAGGLVAVVLAAAMHGRGVEAASSCEALATLALPNTTVTAAQTVEAGAFRLPTQANPSRAFSALPVFCRVAATLAPSSDSDIKVEIWLPATNWNGKVQAVGNGAFNGTIAYPALATALARGYAAASTDTGHVGGSASFAIGHPEKVIDFGYRAVHEMTVAAKAIVAAHYGSAPRFSYWNGCSAGGRQALKAAQRFPADFDGIIAGAPGLDWTGRAAQAARIAQVMQRDEGARLPPEQLALLHASVLQACDARDGVKDGVVGDPQRCAFDPGVLQCTGAEGAACLTSAQARAAKLIYAPVVNPQTKREISGLFPGSELGWTELGWSASARATALDQFRFLVFKDPSWDLERFDAGADVARAEEADKDTINALDPSLTAFIARGGKLIQYHGWSDPQISPGASVQYYERVAQARGGPDAVHGAYRLFMAPGMAHCSGGEGPDTFDMVTALEQWVEKGVAPDRIIASKSANGAATRSRPLCPHPQLATYSGSGSTDDAANFTCKAP